MSEKVRQATEFEYYDNGSVKAKAQTKDGKPHGEVIWYYPDGAVKGKGQYKDGKLISP